MYLFCSGGGRRRRRWRGNNFINKRRKQQKEQIAGGEGTVLNKMNTTRYDTTKKKPTQTYKIKRGTSKKRRVGLTKPKKKKKVRKYQVPDRCDVHVCNMRNYWTRRSKVSLLELPLWPRRCSLQAWYREHDAQYSKQNKKLQKSSPARKQTIYPP